MIDAGRGPIINIASLTAERCVDRYPLAAYSAAKAVNTGQHLLVDGGRPAYRASLAWPRGLVSVPWIEEDAARAGGSSRPLRWRQRRPLTARWPATSHSKSVMQNPPVSRSTILEAARQRGAARSSRGVLHKPQGNHVIEYSSGTGSSGWRGWACSSGTWPGCGAAEFRRLPRFRGGDSRRASPLRWRIGPPRSRPEGRHTRWGRPAPDTPPVAARPLARAAPRRRRR